ncbi:MAG TPA: hypothetical protein VFH56_07560 [Acidimicrobiales bacterium]|nr:hypothetical protein [Acidimicrobiales bacterium]
MPQQLDEEVLPLIRTRADVWRWSVANDHGHRMHHAVDVLEAAARSGDPAEVYAVTHKALASAIKVIARADDSSGIIGDACRRLLDLHAKAAAAAGVPAAKLIDWMMKFQFEGEIDYFQLDPVAYVPALGATGMKAYRSKLDERRRTLGPEPTGDGRWASPHAHDWLTLEWNDQRLAVYDRDVDAIIRTHAKDRRVAAWYLDTAKALSEIGQIDKAIEWAGEAIDVGPWHQSLRAADYWCQLLAEQRPGDLVEARLEVFRRWPSSSTAAQLHAAAAQAWEDFSDEVMSTLVAQPRDAVLFALLTLKDVSLAWDLAHTLELDDDRTWSDLVKAYEKIDPLAVLPVLIRLVHNELVEADAQHYRVAARRLAKMRKLAAGSAQAAGVDDLIGQLRETHRRRPRLQQEFDRAGLP